MAQGGRSLRRLFDGLSTRLYWRTFALIALLVWLSISAWFQAFRLLQRTDQVRYIAREVVTVVDLAQLAMHHAGAEGRAALLADLARNHEIALLPHAPGDQWVPARNSDFARRLVADVHSRAPQRLLFADRVNGQSGMWVGFDVDQAPYWLRLRRSRLASSLEQTWVIGGLLATLLAMVGAAVIAGFVSRPLRDLGLAIARVRGGDFSQQLDEEAGAAELREVNRGFNRMARALQEFEQDRALMLAGISHDIRTPLARLRLEAELSVPDPQARDDIISDIEQADAIISKFMEYASTAQPARERVDLADLVSKLAADYAKHGDIVIRQPQHDDAPVLADPLELQRVLVNVIENARKYGRTPGTQRTEIDADFVRRGDEIVLSLRDHGKGVPPEQLPLLTRPFFRGDQARTADRGAGLGLAIADKTLARMGGGLQLSNAPGGGLVLRIRLPRDPLDKLPPPVL